MILGRILHKRHNIFKSLYLTIQFMLIKIFKIFNSGTFKENNKTIHKNFRGLPYLTIKKDKSLRCISCMLCVIYCPSNCIEVVPDEKEQEAPPLDFKLDVLKCVFCGLCVDACPVDAIRMGEKHLLANHSEYNFILNKDKLVSDVISSVNDKDRSELKL